MPNPLIQRRLIRGIAGVSVSAPGTPAAKPTFYFRADDGPLFQNSNGTTAAASNNDPVGYWGDTSDNARHIIQATSNARPLLQTASPSILFDGTNDYLAYSGAIPDTQGTLSLVFKTGATAFATRGAQAIVSSADTGVANEWFEVGLTSEGRVYVESNVAGTKHTVVGSSFLDVSTNYSLFLIFDDVDYYMQVNAVEQNPLTIENVGTFAWFGDVAGADNLVMGGTVTSGGQVRPFQGEVYECKLINEDIT